MSDVRPYGRQFCPSESDWMKINPRQYKMIGLVIGWVWTILNVNPTDSLAFSISFQLETVQRCCWSEPYSLIADRHLRHMYYHYSAFLVYVNIDINMQNFQHLECS